MSSPPSPIAGRHVVTVAGREVALRAPFSEVQAQAARRFVVELQRSLRPDEITTATIMRGALGRRLLALLGSPPDAEWDSRWSEQLLADLDAGSVSDTALTYALVTAGGSFLLDELGRILRGDT